MAASFQQVIQDIRSGKFASVYFLSGEEVYYIDEIEKEILKHAFQPGEEDFNLDILYGKDISNLKEVTNICQQYPVFASRRVVIVREAQHLNKKDQWEPLSNYINNAMDTTVLVILFKHKNLDKRWEVTKKIVSKAMYFEAAKLKDSELPVWIRNYIESAGLKIDAQHASVIADNLGNDLSRIVNETEKLTMVLPKGSVVDADAIEKYIGISRDFNSLELLIAVQRNQVAKAVKIIDYFSKNPKAAPFPLVIGLFYSFYQKLWLYFQLSPQERNDDKLLGGYYQAQNVKNVARDFTPSRAEKAIAILAEYDVKSKGVGNKNASEHDLMLEMVYKLLH